MTQSSNVKVALMSEACLQTGIDELFIVERVPNTQIRMASKLLEAGLNAGLDEVCIVKRIQNT